MSQLLTHPIIVSAVLFLTRSFKLFFIMCFIFVVPELVAAAQVRTSLLTFLCRANYFPTQWVTDQNSVRLRALVYTVIKLRVP